MMFACLTTGNGDLDTLIGVAITLVLAVLLVWLFDRIEKGKHDTRR